MGTFISFEMSVEFQAEWLLCCIYFREQINLVLFFSHILHVQQSYHLKFNSWLCSYEIRSLNKILSVFMRVLIFLAAD